jgi:hypothetical protein
MPHESGPGLGEVAAYRPWFREHVRPPNYSPRLHVLVHLGPLVVACGYAVSRLSEVSGAQWFTVPVYLVVGSYFVYWFHRFVLHRPRRWARLAYRRHTLQHHRFFDYGHITPDEPQDLYVTLFPWWSGGLLSLLAYGFAQGLTPWLGVNVAHLAMFMMAFYMLLYEFVHTVCHLPHGHWLTRMPVLAFLREHHRIHHDPSLMGKYNFNIVIPLFDWIHGALLRKRP